MREKTEIFKALSEPNRVRILLMLKHRPLCVCEITSILKLKTATVSSHLSILRQAGFVVDEKDGKWINYQINYHNNDPMKSTIIDNLDTWFGNTDIAIDDRKYIQTIDRYLVVCNGKS